MAEHEVDIRGLVCPVPLIEMTKVGRMLNKGDKLTIIMDHRSKTNVEGWAKGNDFEIADFKKGQDKIIFALEKNG